MVSKQLMVSFAWLSANGGASLRSADDLPELVDLSLLLFDLPLLLFESVDEHRAQMIVPHAFDQSLIIVSNEPRVDFLYVLRAKADILYSPLFPIVGNWAQLVDER